MKKALIFTALAFALVPAASGFAFERGNSGLIVADSGGPVDGPVATEPVPTEKGCTETGPTAAMPKQTAKPAPVVVVDGR
jgi:hypothetical protein